MNRYQNVFRLKEMLYTRGSPVLIRKGALLKDIQTGTILLQLKLKNLTAKTILALKISVQAYDISNAALQGIEESQYLDLYASCGSCFGDNRVIQMPNPNTRYVDVRVVNVIFQDKTEWNATIDAKWEQVAHKKQPLLSSLSPSQLAQYRRGTTAQAYFVPYEEENLWFCTCGEINGSQELLCAKCQKAKNTIFSAFDPETLSERSENYEQKRKEATAFRKKAGIAIGSVILALLLAIFLPNAITYSQAKTLMNDYDYTSAIQKFEKLEDYRDSERMVLVCERRQELEDLYQQGLEAMENTDYFIAESRFSSIISRCEDESVLLDLIEYRDTETLHTYCEAKSDEQSEYSGIESAFELYNTLPEDYKDVKQRKETIEPLLKFCGKWSRDHQGGGESRAYFNQSTGELTLHFRDDDYIYSDNNTFTRSYSRTILNSETNSYEKVIETVTLTFSENQITLTFDDGSGYTYTRMEED